LALGIRSCGHGLSSKSKRLSAIMFELAINKDKLFDLIRVWLS
jgi:hypothetical protein